MRSPMSYQSQEAARYTALVNAINTTNPALQPFANPNVDTAFAQSALGLKLRAVLADGRGSNVTIADLHIPGDDTDDSAEARVQ